MVRRTRSHWHLWLTALLLSVGAAVAVFLSVDEAPTTNDVEVGHGLRIVAADPDSFIDSVFLQIDGVVAELGIGGAQVHVDSPADPPARIVIHVPSDLPLETVNLHLTRMARRNGGHIVRAIELSADQAVRLQCGVDSVITTVIELRRDSGVVRRHGRISIVLDDFSSASQNGDLATRFCGLPQTLTLAILPNEGEDVGRIGRMARQGGHELLLHLPMEPEAFPAEDPGPGAIMVGDDAATVRMRLRDALRRVPGVEGVNNHMGSRATADRQVMEHLMDELQRLGLFFLDSRTTSESVAHSVATSYGIPSQRRDLFIDPVDDQADIERRLWELAELAADQGQAIGIGHDREQTLLALQSVLPRLETRGYRFVPVSALAQ
ncbi:MAG: divergent polysaccharide deacetylase family protein [Candidatus Latescibacterota bacterium]|nr:divergent polysaccharide deacetylase family protein [Candidatus Latescibacterota bacterium]